MSAAGPPLRPPGRPKDAAPPSGESSAASSGGQSGARPPGGQRRGAPIGGEHTRGSRDPHLVETRIDSQAVFDGKLLHVRRDTVRLPDGGTATREFIVHPGAVLVVPVLADGRYVLERQFRYPLGRVFLEFPAGKLDPGESTLDTAKRELVEEAGYTAREWTCLGVIHPVISYSSEFIELWLAEHLTHVGNRLDAGEFLELVTLSHAELLAAFDRGEVTDAKTVAALFWLERRLARK